MADSINCDPVKRRLLYCIHERILFIFWFKSFLIKYDLWTQPIFKELLFGSLVGRVWLFFYGPKKTLSRTLTRCKNAVQNSLFISAGLKCNWLNLDWDRYELIPVKILLCELFMFGWCSRMNIVIIVLSTFTNTL